MKRSVRLRRLRVTGACPDQVPEYSRIIGYLAAGLKTPPAGICPASGSVGRRASILTNSSSAGSRSPGIPRQRLFGNETLRRPCGAQTRPGGAWRVPLRRCPAGTSVQRLRLTLADPLVGQNVAWTGVTCPGAPRTVAPAARGHIPLVTSKGSSSHTLRRATRRGRRTERVPGSRRCPGRDRAALFRMTWRAIVPKRRETEHRRTNLPRIPRSERDAREGRTVTRGLAQGKAWVGWYRSNDDVPQPRPERHDARAVSWVSEHPLRRGVGL